MTYNLNNYNLFTVMKLVEVDPSPVQAGPYTCQLWEAGNKKKIVAESFIFFDEF